jgi:DNA-binding transcriptional ArsR family regulator
MLTLSDMADSGTAEIPEKHTPSLTVLARETGLGRSTVAEHLAALEEGGWVTRIRPDVAAAQLLGERTQYKLTAPKPAPLVQQKDQVVQESDQGGSPGAGPDLVQEPDGASPGAGHKKNDLNHHNNRSTSSSAKPPKKATKAKRPPKVKPIRDDVERVCAHLAARLVENGCKKPEIGDKWRDAARLLMDKDGRTETQVIACIDWATSNEFWKPNIQSMPTLREKYDQLRMQADRERKATRASPGSDLARIGDYGTRPPMRSTTDERVNGWLAIAAAAEARTQTGVEA